MIRLPKEASAIMQKLEENGFKAYAVGGCVRDSLRGEQPVDFDLATDAKLDEIKKLFPEAEVISEKMSVVRFDYTTSDQDQEGIICDLATFRIDGEYSDFRRPDSVTFTDSIEKDLGRRDFTINAMADNPDSALVDPYGGQFDLKRKVIRTVGDPAKRFREDPIRIMRAVKFASRFGFTIDEETTQAIKENGKYLANISRDHIRNEFEEIMNSKCAGDGMILLYDNDLFQYVLGEEVAHSIKKGELEKLDIVANGIEDTYQVLERRLGLFYRCFEAERAEKAVEFLGYSGIMKESLMDAIYLSGELDGINTKVELKDFLVKYGYERYDYLHNVAKVKKAVFHQREMKILKRNVMMHEIAMYKEPVFVEDLAINGNDLINEGIAEGKDIGRILLLLTDVVHRRPEENTREILLKHASHYSKMPVLAHFRKIKWTRTK